VLFSRSSNGGTLVDIIATIAQEDVGVPHGLVVQDAPPEDLDARVDIDLLNTTLEPPSIFGPHIWSKVHLAWVIYRLGKSLAAREDDKLVGIWLWEIARGLEVFVDLLIVVVEEAIGTDSLDAGIIFLSVRTSFTVAQMVPYPTKVVTGVKVHGIAVVPLDLPDRLGTVPDEFLQLQSAIEYACNEQ